MALSLLVMTSEGFWSGGLTRGNLTMCDYSLVNVKSRSAKVGDKLTTRNFGTGTRGFAAPEDVTTAVCVLPGTELAFSQEPTCAASGFLGWGVKHLNNNTRNFRGGHKEDTGDSRAR